MQTTANSEDKDAVQIANLCRNFGQRKALDNVSISIPNGCVFGLIGANGAGKTTLLKHILGTLYAQSGSVHVFGRDPVSDPVGVLGRIGYMSENRDIPNWMRVGDLISYTANFYPTWDKSYAAELQGTFDLDPKTRVRNLSRGQRARTCLLLAIAHRPDLLILDEPSSGLDPVVRRDILGAIIRTIADEGRTVLFSSHLLDEVERVADRIAILHQGHIEIHCELESVKTQYRRVTLQFDVEPQSPPVLQACRLISGSGREWSFAAEGELQPLRQAAAKMGAEIVEESYLSLDELFMSRIGNQHASRPVDSQLAVNKG